MGVLQDQDDDPPALEIDLVAQADVGSDIMQRDLTKGQLHGPAVIKDNRTACSTYDARSGRLYAGMALGEVLFWQVKLAEGAFGPRRSVGEHAVRP